jgi:hypothetical protein
MLLNFIVYQLLLLVGCRAGIENPGVLGALARVETLEKRPYLPG